MYVIAGLNAEELPVSSRFGRNCGDLNSAMFLPRNRNFELPDVPPQSVTCVAGV